MKTFFSIAILFVLFFNAQAQIQNATFSKKVVASSDDAEESEDGSYCTLGSSDIELVYDTWNDQGNQRVGIRFTDINIPVTATIINAYIQFTADENTSEPTNLKIKGEAVENSTTFIAYSNSINSRTKTSESVAWNNIPTWSSGQAGENQQTPNLSNIVTEIITNNNWQYGNPITFIIDGTGKRIADSFDGNPSTAPELIIEYSVMIYDNDLSISNFISPPDAIAPKSDVPISIEIKNSGNITQSNFDVSYLINGGTIVTETTSLTLEINQTAIYTFNQTANLSILGEYKIQVDVILANDESTYDNIYTKNLSVEETSVDNVHWGSKTDPLNGLTLSWRSQGTSDQIKWGYTNNYNEGTFNGIIHKWNNGSLFDYTFPSLTPNSTIHYSVYNSSMGGWTADRTFETASNLDVTDFSFSVLGDSRTYVKDWQAVANATEETEFMLFMGDIVASGSVENQWDDWMSYGENLVSDNLIFHCYGNHDKGNGNYENLFVLPDNEFYYSFEYGNAVFICLDSENSSNTTQYNWLLSTLESNKDKTWKIIFFHRPFYTSGGHAGEMDPYFGTWWKAFDDYNVDLIFNGHVHNYQRAKPVNRNVSTTNPVAQYGSNTGQGICQIVSGGAGAPLYTPELTPWLEVAEDKLHYCTIDITGDELILKAKDVNQNVFDEITLSKIINVETIKTGNINIYPNPNNSNFIINFNDTEEIVTLELYNIIGELVYNKEFKNISQKEINLSNLESGIYFVNILTKTNSFTKKIIINNKIK